MEQIQHKIPVIKWESYSEGEVSINSLSFKPIVNHQAQGFCIGFFILEALLCWSEIIELNICPEITSI